MENVKIDMPAAHRLLELVASFCANHSIRDEVAIAVLASVFMEKHRASGLILSEAVNDDGERRLKMEVFRCEDLIGKSFSTRNKQCKSNKQ